MEQGAAKGQRAFPEWTYAYRRRALVFVYLALAISAAATSVANDARDIDLLTRLAVGSAIVAWCVLDAPSHGKRFEHGFVLPLVMTYPAGIAVYLIWTRGSRRGFVAYAKAIAPAILLSVAAYGVGRF
jgi:hypothetical protein